MHRRIRQDNVTQKAASVIANKAQIGQNRFSLGLTQRCTVEPYQNCDRRCCLVRSRNQTDISVEEVRKMKNRGSTDFSASFLELSRFDTLSRSIIAEPLCTDR